MSSSARKIEHNWRDPGVSRKKIHCEGERVCHGGENISAVAEEGSNKR
jgi:hypothetical protein